MSVIPKIRELREEAQLTQSELARELSTSQRNVSNWETGTSEPDLATVCALADFFGIFLLHDNRLLCHDHFFATGTHRLFHLIFHLCGNSALFRRERKAAKPIKPYTVDTLHPLDGSYSQESHRSNAESAHRDI